MKCIGAICQHYRVKQDTTGEWFAYCEWFDDVIDENYECPAVKEENNG